MDKYIVVDTYEFTSINQALDFMKEKVAVDKTINGILKQLDNDNRTSTKLVIDGEQLNEIF